MMKNILIFIGCLLLLSLLDSCKKTSTSTQFANAYTRIVFIDAPGQAKVQFYLDGKVNANGDSSMNNPNGTVYQPDNSIATTTLINYPSGGWTDNSPVNIIGAYGYNYDSAAGYAYFPNPTDRIALGAIKNNINYYNWAALPANRHELTLYSVLPASLYGNPIFVKGDQFLDQSIDLEGGAIQTYFVVNQAPCKYYVASGINSSPGLPIYSVQESINYYTNQFGLVSIKDHPDHLPVFKDSSAYIRFMNVTPTYQNQGLDQSTQSIDVYMAPIYGTRPDIWVYYSGAFTSDADSIGAEFPVAKNLGRYQSAVDMPFYELNVAANMHNNNAGPNDSLSNPRVPRYYRVLAYASGHSAATGDLPLAYGDWMAVYSQFPAYDYTTGISTQYPLGTGLDSWLIRSDGTNYHPSICTIPIAVSGDLIPQQVSTNYLSFRSCINYTKVGVNNVYFGN